ncbi:MAG: choice-of-anchor tandem repeat GloVer-containing protein [Terriglobales bacterium]|jgi:uncharacterized repeat protein (TIGR03803 family)
MKTGVFWRKDRQSSDVPDVLPVKHKAGFVGCAVAGSSKTPCVIFRLSVLCLVSILPLLAVLPAHAQAQYTESVLYSFTGYPTSEPLAGLISDSKGNLYGTVFSGAEGQGSCLNGDYGCGAVFELSPPTTCTGSWTETVLHYFDGGSAGDGGLPSAGLVFDSKGNLYGTTMEGGAHNLGTVFELSPPSSAGGSWSETVLYSFCSVGGSSCTDGEEPQAGLILDAKGNLYGNAGVTFELSPPSTGSGAWTEQVLAGGTGSLGGLVFDSKGNLYGTSYEGGAAGFGTVFELSPPASGSGPWTETTLWTFAGAPGDGELPYSVLIFDSKGNLYGTTSYGGNSDNAACVNAPYKGCGTVFEVSPPSSGSGPWTEKLLWNFAGPPGDGDYLIGGLIFDSKGNLYGTAELGGAGDATDCGGSNCGLVYELSPPSSGSGPWTESILWNFAGAPSDGSWPYAGLIFDSKSNLYSTTYTGGTNNAGTIFELMPKIATAAALSATPASVAYGSSGPVVMTAKVTPSASGCFTASGAVNFFNGSAQVGSVTLTGGTATFDYNPSSLAAGTYSLTAVYAGNSNFTGSTSASQTLTVTTVTTTTTVDSALNPSNSGEAVTIGATISPGSPAPTGTVDFTSNGTVIPGCSAVAVPSSATALCTATGLATGADLIKAVYSGDHNYIGSNGTLTQQVNADGRTASKTTITPNLNPSASGQPVALTASVTPSASPAPTGSLAFTSNGNVISGCSDIVISASNTVNCTTSALTVGTDSIVAAYSGDSHYAASAAGFSQIVTATATPMQFVAVTPCRVVDTRNANGTFGGPAISAGTFRTFPISLGACTIPATALAYSLNVTVIPSGPLGYLTAWPGGTTQPLISLLNSTDGRIKANAAIMVAGASQGAVSVYASNTTNVAIDINGYFTPAGSSTLEFYPLTPCRVVDTRRGDGALGGPSLIAATERDFPVQSGVCNIPSTAQAYSLNFTAIPPTGGALGYLTVWPQGEARPTVSTLNDLTGTIVANAAIVAAGTGGGVAVYPSNDTNLAIDVNGYFAAPGSGDSLYSLVPCRVLDTRTASGEFSGELAVNVAGSACAAPSGAQAYVFNATVVPDGDLGYLTLWPDSETQPVVSTLNAVDGAITSNMALVPNKNGEIDAYASGTTQLVLDLYAYFVGSLTGSTWALTATSSVNGDVLQGNLALSQSGSSVTGTLTCTSETNGCPSNPTMSVNGMVSGTNVSFTVAGACSGATSVTLTGTIVSGGSSMSGSYSQPAGGSCNADTGTWSAIPE